MRNIPVTRPYFDEKEIIEIKKVLASGWVAQGPKVQDFENLVAQHEGAKYAVATTSCTTALHLVMQAMGLGPEHDIIVPSYTFVATANAARYTGANVILADVKASTFNIDTAWIADYIPRNYHNHDDHLVNDQTGRTLFGMVAVHEFGLCAEIPAINALASQYHLKVIEDSACAMGATIGKKHQGAFGNPSCLSFHPRKSITTGEGGMILTDDEELADKVRKLRSHGASLSEVARHHSKGYLLPEYNELGFNYRMTDIQAAVGVAQMAKFDWLMTSRIEKAHKYDQLLKKVRYINLPTVPAGYGHTYQSYVCLLDEVGIGVSVDEGHAIRNEMMDILEQKGIATRQGTHAVHTLGLYKKAYGFKASDFPQAYRCDRLSIALPLYVAMTDGDQKYVATNLEKALGKVISSRVRGRK